MDIPQPFKAMALASMTASAERRPARRRPVAEVCLGAGAALLLGLASGCAQAQAEPGALKVSGPEEVVIGSSQMTCRSSAGIDVPDMPPTAFRRADGTVVLLAGNRQNIIAVGPDLDHLTRRGCQRILISQDNGDPSLFRDQEWLVAVSPLGGGRAVGLVHDEYHGDLHNRPGCPTVKGRGKLCWYASTTLALSSDGARTFQVQPAPGGVIAAPRLRYSDGLERQSMANAKLVRKGEYLYALTSMVDRPRNIRESQCLLRASVAAVDDWRAWDGHGFTLKVGSPYGARSDADCPPVFEGQIMSVKFVPSKGQFVALAMRQNEVDYVWSPDLVTWSTPRRLLTFESPHMAAAGDAPGGGAPEWYFSLLDPDSSSPGFDTIEHRPYVYFVRVHTSGGRILAAERDVLREPIEIQ